MLGIYLALGLIGGIIAIANDIGIKLTIKYLMQRQQVASGIVIVSFFSRSAITVGIFYWLMHNDYRRLLALVIGFTITRFINVMVNKTRTRKILQHKNAQNK